MGHGNTWQAAAAARKRGLGFPAGWNVFCKGPVSGGEVRGPQKGGPCSETPGLMNLGDYTLGPVEIPSLCCHFKKRT